MSQATYTQSEILSQLDACAADFTFPMLDNGYVYLGDTRLSAYRDSARWAIVIEIFGANQREDGHDGLRDCLYCFGNCLHRPPGTANEDFLSRTSDGPAGPTFDDEYGWYVSKEIQSILVRGQVVPVDLSDSALASKEIDPVEDDLRTGEELMRSLLPEYRDMLLATEEELRQRIPIDLPLILRLEEWHHPDLVNDEKPSDSRTFQMIADVLVSGDPALYQPTEAPNTHWSNWPEGGTL